MEHSRQPNYFVAISVLAATADIATKLVAVQYLEKDDVSLLSNMPFGLETIRNRTPYANWVWQEAGWVGLGYAAAMAVLLLAATRTLRTNKALAGKGLVIGGAIGNFTCRIVREPGFGDGHVVDWIRIPSEFHINLADIFVIAGMVMLLVEHVKEIRRREKQPKMSARRI